MKKLSALIVSALIILCLAACASGPEITAPPSVSKAPAKTEKTVSFEELHQQSEEYMNNGKYEEAYLTGMEMTQHEPENEIGYRVAIFALFKMSESNYSQINALLQKAPDSIVDVDRYKQLIDELKSNEPALTVKWPYVADAASGEVNTTANTCGNISAGGYAAAQGDWVYFRNNADGGKLYKIKPMDMSERKKISDDPVSFVNVIGETIYYVAGDSGTTSIYSIRTDGANRTKLADGDHLEFLSIDNGWVYFGGIMDGQGGIFKIRTDGTEKSLVANTPTKYPYAYNGYVYYVFKDKTGKEAGTLWRIPENGGAAQKLVDAVVDFYTVNDDSIYYLSGNKIYKMGLEGSSITEFFSFDGKISTFNLYGGYLFVSCRDDKAKSDRIKIYDLVSRNELKSFDFYSERLFVSEKFLFYSDGYDNEKTNRIQLDNWNTAKIDE